MSWRKVTEMDERVSFVILAREEHSNISELCRQFNISRKTGYKLLDRYRVEGIKGVAPRSRRPLNNPCSLSGEVVCKIVELRQKHPRWGGRKLQSLLENDWKEVPSIRSIERVLERCELTIIRRKRRQKHISSNEVVQPAAPNEVWTIDFKGQWRMRNGQYCYPLTLRDEYTKFILDIAAFPGPLWEPTKERMQRCFKHFGLPKYIRSDNGNPFASVKAVAGLSRLSAWWIKLGVIPNRIPPASPQYNGAHERMHLDMMRELEIFPGKNLTDEQARFNDWKTEYNSVRPHESLQMKTPKSCYQKSKRYYDPKEPDFSYSLALEPRRVCNRGTITWQGKRVFISNALRKETIACKRENENSISIWFCNFLLGYTDKNFRSPLGENLLS